MEQPGFPKGEDGAGQRMNRRDFVKLCAMITATLALPVSQVGRVMKALSAAPRLPVVWLNASDCTGDSESFIRASQRTDPLKSGVTDPSIVDLLLDSISLDYHETLMVPSGWKAEKSLTDTIQQNSGNYVLVVEGGIPTGSNGVYCTVAGKTALSRVTDAAAHAKAIIAAGTCAWEGGLPAAAPNPTTAVGVKDVITNLNILVNLPGCPVNVANLVATIVYLITYNQLPPVDSSKRPLFAYGDEIHDHCPRHDHYEAHRFVQAWGDAGHQQGWCLYKMGCKGPRTKSNCTAIKWNDGTSWCIQAGHGCIGCTSARFWDANGSIYTPVD